MLPLQYASPSQENLERSIVTKAMVEDATAQPIQIYKNTKGTLMKIYLDNNATTKIDPLVKVKMQPFLKSSTAIQTRSIVMAWRCAPPSTKHSAQCTMHSAPPMRTTSSSHPVRQRATTPSLKGVFFKHILQNPQKNHIITTAVEHPSIQETLHFLQEHGVDVTFIEVQSDGSIDPQKIKDAITDANRAYLDDVGEQRNGGCFSRL